ncbi:sugar porter family MFS transporter [Alistipes sp.]|uniref:sugar porter family MFS transporter n=1 Tax=Alistipes sp. TaxID=1872444 RepID=UPI0025B94266|nr:sugar porter family MFS transporter [Alistipes sp.]MCI7141275.1 sugar porter family MFS transporter [Alistipes sp.]MDY5396877.1 sugar porter family MFS transporter [Alistipes sp.]
MENRTNTGYVVFLSIVAAIGGILFGYDTAVISGTISSVEAQFSLNAMQVGWFVGCALVGSILGVAVAGILSDRFGRKLTMLVAAILFTASGIGCAVCQSFTELVIYRIIGGIGIGVVSIVSPMYISEVAVARWRGTLVSLYQLAITIGFLAAYLVNFQILKAAETAVYDTPWLHWIMVDEMWRGMLGSNALPALLFFIVIFFIPESPRWLILRNRTERAHAVLEHIYRSSAAADSEITTIREAEKAAPKSEWRSLTSPGIRRALLIGVSIAMLGQFMGVNAVLYYGPTIFENAGLSSGDSLFSQVLVGVVNMLTTVIALVIIDRVGRKQLVYWGVSGMILSLLCIGTYFLAGSAWGLSSTFLLIFFLAYVFCCAISISAVIFVLLSEMYPTRVRGLAMSIAGFSLWVGTYLIGQLTPWMLETLTPAGTFFLFAAMCIPYILIMWRAVPETTGRSLEEIERYWQKFDK